ncbi:hypothetical protein PtrSN002B_003623 [Pyrenophora tritici-repentis]|uniref:Transformer multi-domain protein n=1 Tax=Pyrenophora tritici-repentis TaxID=45151 RepID=A0A2W1I0J9_9PLEO|nr:hypothetical protein PtrV1_10092 [Pyrenophora tritici-repentis]KAF7567189.1 Transformer multi-domain protein [Pyrenophora tritici-repentis]KAG9381787.1 hypothetical protein A1F94_007441 [Pyrenophora tritici-repentis]KAI0588477.1 hypothetical protein Alg215_00915 [Pyrenophora tritici-repentis]KAI0591863.1 hypothetical protein Alg130_00882 [Pyrenophora tritici-repentis]
MRLPQLEERALDPATMDPTRFSILKVLKSAMPSGTDVPMPKADFEPEWYQKLPVDVKEMLPGLYPVIGAAAATSEVLDAGQSTSTSAAATATTTEGVSTTAPSSVLVSSAESSLPSSSASVESTLHTPSSTGSVSMPPTLPANKTTLASGPSPKPTVTLSLPSAATSSRPANAGVRMTVKTEMLAAVAWLCVGAGFVIYA